MRHPDTTSYWIDSQSLPVYSALDRDLEVDVAVVGGGITGITTAYLLKRAGRRVALVERRRSASVDTGHTTAHLTCVTDARLSDLVERFGRDHAQAVWDAGLAAIAQIDELVTGENIQCDLTWIPAYLHAPIYEAQPDVEQLSAEARVAADLGFDAEYVYQVPFVERPGVRFDGQAIFHPRKYLRALLEAIPGDGSHVFEYTTVEEVSDKPLSVVCGPHRVTCGRVVLATHTPLVGRSSLISATLFQTKLALYTTYAMAGRIPHNVAPAGSYWDTADPYNYLRVEHRHDFDLVILGGNDHKTGQAEDTNACFGRLEKTMRRLFPDVDVTHRWSGQVIETHDGLPFIGETADAQFAATGFSGNGMTFGTLAAMMACDWSTGRSNPWRDLFSPSRTGLRGGVWDYVRENKDYPYYLIRDRFAGAEGKSLRALGRGEGKILELDGKRVAAFRDRAGTVTKLSAICTHLGCVVDWNVAESTWDCPCHGSRFDPQGKVIAGPAESPLNRIG
ncbi:MAG: FAD-dependent oxidoreductase [Acidobacteria bacterium]|nr:FAD-dependent oxidoreductase [Acidobacteriota bacterium]